MALTPSQPSPPDDPLPVPAQVPAAVPAWRSRVGVRLAAWFLRLSWRNTMGLLALLTVIACLAAAGGLVGAWGLLKVVDKDMTLSNATLKYWPKWLGSIHLLQRNATAYLEVAGAALFLVLPCALAILERLWFVGYRRPDSGR
jgi:hypothetical protein